MPTSRSVLAATIPLLAAGCAPLPTPRNAAPAQVYDAAAVYRLDFQGIRLGMARDEVCRVLVANGYYERDETGCGPRVVDIDIDDQFDGSAPGQCRAEHCRPGTPAAAVRFLSLRYERRADRDVVTEISVWTNEPLPRDALAARTTQAWGPPTFRNPVGTVLYGASRRQADDGARDDFDFCRRSPECGPPRDGLDCAALLNELGTPYAQVAVYDWGRSIRIEDPRAAVEALRATGRLRGGRLIPRNLICMPHEMM